MTADSFLSSIVELAIGIAGFAGIIAAIRQRGVTQLPAQQRVQIQVLLFASAAAICFALLPGILTAARVDEASIWKIGSCGLLLWYAGATPYRLRQVARLGIPLPFPRAMQAVLAVVVILQLYNLASPGLPWPYLVGVFSLIVNGFGAFLLLLLHPVAADD